MDIKTERTEGGMRYIVTMPPIQIIDVSNFPDILIEWNGARCAARVLNRDMVQIGNVILVRPQEE